MKKHLILFFTLFISIFFSQIISLDNAFGNGGYSGFRIQNNNLSSSVILPNGDFITGYSETSSADDYIYLRKTNQYGIIDNSYYGSFHLRGAIKFKKLAINNNKLIVLATYSIYPYNTRDILFLRFNLDGTIDTSFGNNGYQLYSYDSTSSDIPIDIMFDDLGNSYVYSQYGPNTSSNSSNYFLIKINNSGLIDSSFGLNGRLYLYYYYSPDEAKSFKFLPKIFLQNDGKFLFAGAKKNLTTGNWESYIERKLQDGSNDKSFSNNGELVIPNSEHSLIKNFEYNYADNSILILHEFDNINYPNDRIFITKIKISDGSLISNFGINGTTAQYIFSNAPRLVLEHIKTLSNSKILVVGSVSDFYANPSINSELFVMRFNSDGSIDYTTSSSGFHIFDTAPPNFSIRADYVINLFSLNSGSFVIGYSGYSSATGSYSYLTKFNGATLGLVENNNQKNNSLIIFPNPSNNRIAVSNIFNTNENFDFKIFDFSGNIVYQGKSSFNKKINILDLKIGNYILNIETKNGEKYSEKIIKN